MKIIIAGCGKLGSTIAEQLNMEGHEISVIDANSDVVNRLANKIDVMGVVGNAASNSVLKDAGVENADLVIAVTDMDEINMLSCLIAKKAGNCRTIARVRDPLYHREVNYIKDELGLSMAINPEQYAAQEMSRLLRFPEAMKIDTFARGRLEMAQYELPRDNILCGMSVMDIRKNIQREMIICVVERGEKVIIPNGSFVLEAGDILYFVASPADHRHFLKAIGVENQKIRDVMIVGGSRIAYYLCGYLETEGIEVKIIEKDREVCRELCSQLPDTQMINGDATDSGLMAEEGMADTDAFVSLTGLDEANVFLALAARDSNDHCKLITKVNRMDKAGLLERFDLGSIISPKDITAERIITFVRAMQNGMGSRMETLYRIVDGKAEVMEFLIHVNPAVTDIPIKDMKIRKNILLTAISRQGKTVYPNGNTTILAGDRVVLVTTEKGIHDIEDILE